MATRLTIALKLATGGFSRQVKGVRGDLKGLRASARKMGAGVSRALGSVLDKVAAPGAIAGSLGLAAAGRELLEIEKRLLDLRINASATGGEMDQLKTRLQQLGGAKTGQSMLDLLKAVQELVSQDDQWLKRALGSDLLERIGKAATATGADVTDLAQSVFQMGNAFGLSTEEIGRGLDKMAASTKKGAVLLPDMARLLPEVGAAFKRAGQDGEQGFLRAAAALQIVQRGAASSAQAATQLVNSLDFLQSREGSARLSKELGIEVFKGGKMRDLFEILRELDKATAGGTRSDLLARVFSDKEARSGITSLLRDGDDLVGLVDHLQSAGPVLDQDFLIAQGSTIQQLKTLKNQLIGLMDAHMGPGLEKLNEFLRWLTAHPDVMKKALQVGGGVVGLGIARRLLRGTAGVFGFGGGGGGGFGGGFGGGGRCCQGLSGGGIAGAVTAAIRAISGGGGLPGLGGLGGLGGKGALASMAPGRLSWIKQLATSGWANGAGSAAAAAGAKATGLAALGTGVGGVAAGTLAAGVVLAGGAGVALGTSINNNLRPNETAAIQNFMAKMLAPFSESATRLVQEMETDRARKADRTLRIITVTDPNGEQRMVLQRGWRRG